MKTHFWKLAFGAVVVLVVLCAPLRSTFAAESTVRVTIDGNIFYALQAVCGFSTQEGQISKNQTVMTVSTSVRVWVEITSKLNMSFPELQSLFDLANVVPMSDIKDMKIEFFRGEIISTDTVITYLFKGRIRKFEIYNPVGSGTSPMDQAHYGGLPANTNVLYLELEPIIDPVTGRPFTITN